jgi:DNA repair exonuclease SbcCD ATPase subunit
LEKQEDLLNRNIDYGNRYRDYIRFVRTYPALNCLWEHIQNEHLIKNSPKTALIRISDALNDLELIESTSDIDKDITKTQNLLELARKASAEDMSRVGTRIEEIEKLNGQYIKQLQTLNESLKKSTLMKSRVQTMLDLEEKIIRLEKSFRNATQEHVKALQNEIVDNCIKQIQIELAQKQSTLNSIDMQIGIVNDIASNVERLEKDEEVYKLLVKNLSPTEGLIAEGLLGFIRVFLKKVNAIISKVWTYKLVVLDCSAEESADLDYKFPIVIEDNPKPIDDIRLGSTGIREMIDLAFRVCSAYYLGLADWPLYLDEIGANMDREHRKNVVNLVESLMEQTQVEQLFIISHNYEQYAAISGTDYCVLSTDNIVVPDSYNEFVEIVK